jgi:hypothetical protein
MSFMTPIFSGFMSPAQPMSGASASATPPPSRTSRRFRHKMLAIRA